MSPVLPAMPGKVVVYGGRGGLGLVVVKHLRGLGYWVLSVDIAENEGADSNVLVDPAADWAEQERAVLAGVAAALPAGPSLQAVISVAGGWAGGRVDSQDWIRNADMMWKQSVMSSSIAASLASRHLVEGGLLVLPGARPATAATPGMLGYGMAKAAVHQLVKSLGGPDCGLPARACCLAILPVTLDTPMNRKFMPDADK